MDESQDRLAVYLNMTDDALFETLGESLAGGHAADDGDRGARLDRGKRYFEHAREKLCSLLCSTQIVREAHARKARTEFAAAVLDVLTAHYTGLPLFVLTTLSVRSFAELCPSGVSDGQ